MEAYKVEFKIWADNQEQANKLGELIQNFINEHGAHGRAVTAQKVSEAINRWKDNYLIKTKIIQFFEK